MRAVAIRARPTLLQTFGAVVALGGAMGWGSFGGGIDWRRSGRKHLAKRRASRKVRNRIASESRKRNRP